MTFVLPPVFWVKILLPTRFSLNMDSWELEERAQANEKVQQLSIEVACSGLGGSTDSFSAREF